MIKYLYSVYDKAAGTYSDPITGINDDVARRSFMLECRNEDSMFYQFPTDYVLMKLADFDTAFGIIERYEPIPIARGTDFVRGE